MDGKEAGGDPALKAEWTDTALIDACLAGDEEAWRALVERYSRLIYTIPLRFGFSRPVADEVFQETCLVLLEKLDSVRNRERLSAWLVTVTRRACIQRWRQRRSVQEVGLLEADGPLDQELEDDIVRVERQHLLRRSLQRLGRRCKQLIDALFYETPRPSYEEIAERLEMPVGSIGPTRARCLDKLRRQLAQMEREQAHDA